MSASQQVSVLLLKIVFVVLIHILDKKADEVQFLLSSSPSLTSASGNVNGSKKRPASTSTTQDASQPKKPKIDQNAKSKKLFISVDEYCPVAYEVYIDDDGTIMDASLNQTNATANNNKFYKVQVGNISSHSYSTSYSLTYYSWCAMAPVQTLKHGHDGVEWANVARVPCSVMDHW